MSRAWPDSVDVSGPEYDTKALYDNAGGAEKYYDFIPEPTPQKHMESWIDRRWPKGRWLYIVGVIGSGRVALTSYLLRRMIEKNPATYAEREYMPSLSNSIEFMRSDLIPYTIAELKNANVLILDEFRLDFKFHKYHRIFLDIITSRYERGSCTVITSQISIAELYGLPQPWAKLSPEGVIKRDIASRLIEVCDVYNLNDTTDLRVKGVKDA